MLRLSMDALAAEIAARMGKRSYRKAAEEWGIPTMTLYNLVNPRPGITNRPPEQEILLAIAEGDENAYRKLALLAYGIVHDVPEPAEREVATA